MQIILTYCLETQSYFDALNWEWFDYRTGGLPGSTATDGWICTECYQDVTTGFFCFDTGEIACLNCVTILTDRSDLQPQGKTSPGKAAQ